MKLALVYKYFNYRERHSGMSNFIVNLAKFIKDDINIFCLVRQQKNLNNTVKVKHPFIINTSILLKKINKDIVILFNTIENSIIAFFYYSLIRVFNHKDKIILYQGTQLRPKFFNKMFLDIFDRVFCGSPLIYEEINKVIGKKAIYLPPGVDVIGLNKITPINKNKKIRIGFFGHLEKNKGADMLLNSFIKLDTRDAELILAGNGNLNYYLRNKSKKFNNIKIYNYLNNVKQYIKSCDIVVFPFRTSSKILGLSLVALEARAMGKVLIGTKTPAISQLIEDKKDGFIINDSSELVDKMNLLIKNHKLLKEMANKTKINSRQYDIKKIGRLFLNECRMLLKN